MKTAKMRLFEKIHVSPATECLEWTGYRLQGGYGRIKFNGRMVVAHRVAYELLVGPIPEGLQLDHLCRNRACVRPDHLEPVTARENTLRGISIAAQYAQRTHCDKGHPLSEGNLVPTAATRECRECKRDRQSRYRSRRRSAAPTTVHTGVAL